VYGTSARRTSVGSVNTFSSSRFAIRVLQDLRGTCLQNL
jgi:hypothetical protein